MNDAVDNILDTKGLLCPEPVMLLHQAVKKMAAGGVIEVQATDPSTTRDIPKFCLFLGHELLANKETDGVYYYTIRLAQR